MAKVDWSDDDTTLPVIISRIGKFTDALMLEGVAAGEQIARELQAYARQHHPWQNRTGDTESTTDAEVQVSGTEVTVVLSAGTPYSIFLELARQGRWAWLWPSVIAMQSRMLQIWIEHMGH